MAKWVYSFGDGKAEGRAEMRNLLGGKGANLAEMSSLGLPVPPGFTITTEVCNWHHANNSAYPPELKDEVEALQAFVATEAGKNLLTAYGRAANIVRAEEKKDKALAAQIAGKPDPALLEQAEEKAIAAALAEVERSLGPALKAEDFAGAMAAFARLRAPVDAFFDKVTVNVTDKPELRLNRLKLLNQIRATMDSVADFSKIEG